MVFPLSKVQTSLICLEIREVLRRVRMSHFLSLGREQASRSLTTTIPTSSHGSVCLGIHGQTGRRPYVLATRFFMIVYLATSSPMHGVIRLSKTTTLTSQEVWLLKPLIISMVRIRSR